MNTYKYEAHKPVKYKHIPWFICAYCGLVYLNNDFTRWATKKGCDNENYPGYKSIRIKYTGLQK